MDQKYIMDTIEKFCNHAQPGLSGNVLAEQLTKAILSAIHIQGIQSGKPATPFARAQVLALVHDLTTFKKPLGPETAEWLSSMKTDTNLEGKRFVAEIRKLPKQMTYTDNPDVERVRTRDSVKKMAELLSHSRGTSSRK